MPLKTVTTGEIGFERASDGCSFPFILPVALLDSRGSLQEAGVHTAAHLGALGSDGDAEDVPSAGVQQVGMNLCLGTILDLHTSSLTRYGFVISIDVY